MILRFLNWQGIAGIAVAVTLLAMLTVQKLEAVHWKKQCEKFERLYQQEQAAFALTTANYRAAAAQAQLADKANAERVAADQRSINERTAHDYEARLAAARSLARRLRVETGGPSADPGTRSAAPVPRFSAASAGTDQAAGKDGLPQSDALVATEQAIQLDELIKWVKAQASLDPNDPGVESRPDNR